MHILKTEHIYFRQSWGGNKNFEIRTNDRKFCRGDRIRLLEIQNREYTGRYIDGKIIYTTYFMQEPGVIVFSYRETSRGFKRFGIIAELS